MLLELYLGSNIEVVHNKNKEFKGLLYQDGFMFNAFLSYPKVLIINAEYKLINVHFPIKQFLLSDGNGNTVVGAILFLADEKFEMVNTLISIFCF